MNPFRRNFIFKTSLLFIAYAFGGCKQSEKKLIYTSDTHVSLPEGRYTFMTPRYVSFLEKYKNKDCLFFINGDFIDNVYTQNGKPVGGDKEYQKKETTFFLDVTRRVLRAHKNKVLLNFGSGHDFGSLPLAEKITDQKSIGKFRWGKIDLVWFTVPQASFKEDDDHESNVLTDTYYSKLEKILSESSNAILFSHIPLRTPQTYKFGKWPKGKNLTIPLSDNVYKVIKRNSSKVLAIFTGHIHKSFDGQYETIPLFSFPLIENNSFCELIQKEDVLEVIPQNSTVPRKTIPLN